MLTTNEMWQAIIEGNSGISEREFLQSEIRKFLSSNERKDMLTGRRYYEGKHDVLNKKRTTIIENGKLMELENLPNNKIVDNKVDDLVDQKVNYMLGKPLEIKTEDDRITDIFNRKFQRTLLNVCSDSQIAGKGYLYPYIDANGDIAFKRLKPENILPFWRDDDHTQLDAFVYLYDMEVYTPLGANQTVTFVEFYTKDKVKYYTYQNQNLYINQEKDEQRYINAGNVFYDWGQVPLICFKGNHIEQPIINRVKCLQDALNEMYSILADNMMEDSRNTILVLKNYDGTDLADFRQKLAQYGAVKINTVNGDGGVEALKIEVNTANYQFIIHALKTAIIENGRGFDAKDDRMANNPNQMNIMSMYSDIDLDSNQIEVEFQASFETMLEFIGVYYNILGGNALDDVEFIFNKLTPVNEGEIIDNCRNSVGIISNETIVSNHPWTKNTAEELERLKKEQAELMPDFVIPNGGEEHGE